MFKDDPVRSQETLTLFCSSLEGVHFAVDAASIEELGDTSTLPEDAEDLVAVDLCALFSLPPIDSERPRRTLRVVVQERTYILIVGQDVQTLTVPTSSIRALPVFIAPLTESTGLGGWAEYEQGVLYTLDVDRVPSLVNASTAPATGTKKV